MTTTAGKPGVRARERAYKATILNLQQELERMATSMAGLHATLVTVLAQKGGDVTITPGTMAQMADGKFGFSLTPGPQEGEMTLRVVTEEEVDGAAFAQFEEDHLGVVRDTSDDDGREAQDNTPSKGPHALEGKL
jgi:hypothetical protein